MHRLSLYGALVALLLALAPVSAAPGKFYIIGMGTSPDLVTVRGDRILRQADLFIVEDDLTARRGRISATGSLGRPARLPRRLRDRPQRGQGP